MDIKILGSGCMNCKTLHKRTEEALNELHLQATIEKVEDYQAIAAFNIMKTPGLVIDRKVVVAGFVPSTDKLKEILLAHQDVQ